MHIKYCTFFIFIARVAVMYIVLHGDEHIYINEHIIKYIYDHAQQIRDHSSLKGNSTNIEPSFTYSICKYIIPICAKVVIFKGVCFSHWIILPFMFSFSHHHMYQFFDTCTIYEMRHMRYLLNCSNLITSHVPKSFYLAVNFSYIYIDSTI